MPSVYEPLCSFRAMIRPCRTACNDMLVALLHCHVPLLCCRKDDPEPPDPEQIAKDMARLELIKKKRWVAPRAVAQLYPE